jgi:hypothetical protein
LKLAVPPSRSAEIPFLDSRFESLAVASHPLQPDQFFAVSDFPESEISALSVGR